MHIHLKWIVLALLEFSGLYPESQEGPPGHWAGSLHLDLSVCDCPGCYAGVYAAGARDAGDCICCSHSWREASPTLAVWF